MSTKRKRETLNTKTVDAVNDCSNIVCASYGKDVFLLSYEKSVARYALSRDFKVKRALFTTPIATKSKNLKATFVVAKSRLSVAKTPTATNKVIQLVFWIVNSGCSKNMTGLGHNLFLVGQFCEGDLEVAFHSNTCYVWNLEGDDLLTSSRDSNLYTISFSELAASSLIRTDKGTEFKNDKLWSFYAKLGIVHNTLIARTPQQNGIVERRNCTLVEAARTMLIFLKTLKFLWVKAIATAFFTQNRSVIHTRSLCYPTNDRDDLGKMKPKADIVLCMKNTMRRVFKKCQIITLQILLITKTLLHHRQVIKEDEAPQIVSSSAEQVASEPNTPVLNDNADELVQEDVAKLDRNVFYNPLQTIVFEEAESSSTYQDSSNIHEFLQTHRSTDKWTKNHPVE
ncbi:retrovirus-related pol polyprotein from transposon TNT 1-94 [Tanacetum coccineum]